MMRFIEDGTATSIAKHSVAAAIVSVVRMVRRGRRARWRSARIRSFTGLIAQRTDYIETRGAPGGHQAPEQSDNHRDDNADTKGRRRQAK